MGAWANCWAREAYGRPLFLALSADLAESTSLARSPVSSRCAPTSATTSDRTTRRRAAAARSPSSTNAAMAAGIARSTSIQRRNTIGTASLPPTRATGRSRTCSTGRCGSTRSWPGRGAEGRRSCGCSDTPAPRPRRTAGPTSASSRRRSRSSSRKARSATCTLDPNEVPVLIAAGLAGGSRSSRCTSCAPPSSCRTARRCAFPPGSRPRAAPTCCASRCGRARGGVVVVTGASSTAHLVSLLPEIDRRGLNLKIVAASSPQLFDRQDANYRERILSETDRLDALGITTAPRVAGALAPGRRCARRVAVCGRDDRWRTGAPSRRCSRRRSSIRTRSSTRWCASRPRARSGSAATRATGALRSGRA